MMKYVLRNHRKKAPRPVSTWSGPWAPSLMNIENNTTNNYHDYYDISTLLNQQNIFKSRIWMSLFDLRIAMICFVITTFLLVKDVLSLILFLLIQTSSHLQCKRSKLVGDTGSWTEKLTHATRRTFRSRPATRTFLQSRRPSSTCGYFNQPPCGSYSTPAILLRLTVQSRRPSSTCRYFNQPPRGSYSTPATLLRLTVQSHRPSRTCRYFDQPPYKSCGPIPAIPLRKRNSEPSRISIRLENKIRTNGRTSEIPRENFCTTNHSTIFDGTVGKNGLDINKNYGHNSPDESREKHTLLTPRTSESSNLSSSNSTSISSHPSTTNMTGSSTDGDSGRTTPLATVRPMGVMIRPGQQGALYFDKADVTDFLRRWNIECEDYGLNDNQKCARIIDYCSKETQEIIEILEGYTTSNWDKLQTELKELFWQYDKQRDSIISLNQLIKDAPNLDLNIFVVRYSAISEKLFKTGALSSLDRVIRLINGLPKTLRDQSIDFCTKENWKLSSNDTDKNAPDFSKLKTFILTKAQSAQKRAVLDQERDIMESLDTHSLTTNTVSNLIPTGTNPSPKTPATKDSMEDIIQGIARLTLAIEANTNNLNQRINTSASLETAVNNTPLSSIPSNPPSFSLRTNERVARCIWCDSTDHS